VSYGSSSQYARLIAATLKTIASPSHQTIVLTNTVEYWTIEFYVIVLTLFIMEDFCVVVSSQLLTVSLESH